ncbi:carboxypeptidase regulatory-like domain-containing protein [Daejeonella sp.]|uniref:carboxypeptidase regulatory-like domain-containing protein n=1 Tax=Daejeonella sp. TaxID=2805397 RepID=UPI0039834F60
MKGLRILIITFLSLFQTGLLYSQDTLSLNNLIKKNQKVIEEFPTEKVYLHFDKPYYAVGDTIWFKAYIASGQDQPSDLSKIVYVDVISEKDTLIRTLRIPVVNTSAYGSITLDPLVYKSGNYRVRAYTYWMLNADEEYFFTKNIQIGNAINRQLITSISIKGGDSGGSPRADVRILYKDAAGKIIPNARVSWRLISNFEDVLKGRGTTDSQGMLTLALTTDQKAAFNTGVLETILETPDNKQITSTFPMKNVLADADIQFFPEGGEFVENIRSKVGFKAVGEKGLGIGVTGEIVDNTGKAVTSISSQHLGMGIFGLLPEPGQSYKANLTFSNGIKKTVAIPVAKTTGISLSAINADPASLLLRVTSNAAYFSANRNQNFYIVGRSKGVICYAARASLTSATFTASIPKDKFPTGIAQITLFSSSGEPITERLIFIKQQDVIVLTVNSDKKSYGVRQPVKMTVTAKGNNTPIEGNFSISVINETKVPYNENKESTIFSTFLLSSELKGYIEEPNYYFNQVNEKKRSDLDVLMLTQGYRKFAYKDIIANKLPTISFLPEQGMEFTGTLRTANGMPVSRGSLKLVVPESRFYAEALTDVNGIFRFKNVVVPDSAEVSISARTATAGRNMMIMLDGAGVPRLTKNVNAPDEVLNIDSILNPYLQNSERQYRMSTQMLQEVVVRAAPIKKISHADFPALSGLSMLADHLIDGERFKGCNVMLNCLQGAASGLTFADNTFYVTRVYNSGLRVPVSIFLDGMQIEATFLNNIVPSEVESIEIFLRDDLGLVNRTYGTNGVLSIYSKKDAKKSVTADDLKKLFPPNNVLTFTPQGFIKSREFYSPKYLTLQSRTTGSDLRTTVYWNPRIFTDKEGKMSFEFYNGDNKGDFKATIEGTDIDGNLGRLVYRYKVE